MRLISVFQKFLLATVLLCLAARAMAAPVMEPPEVEVQQITKELLDKFQSNKAAYKKNPEGFFKEVDRLLSPVVAFDQISRYVMGRFAHRDPAQVERFQKEFKTSLIRFYGRALLSLDDTTLEIESVDKTSPEVLKQYREGKQGRIAVKMKVKTSNRSVELFYSMVYIDGRWKARNVTIEGINIAKQFQGQFADAMDKHKKVPYVVEHWSEILESGNKKGDKN
ncbi:hypothetical protein EOPP23_14075 [Endozoicomonas sp. OPT23]|uniref:MlaC/ttg2D family ABC transporter substrate-binding protein n=1 Tax=Endozoicomonas sp. OPT23 TaxID=2072845 RepID=UPI00129AF4E9|nr:ABC transporter substrate-binding protein [Endozoicomonas sp. OPT23]MRI34119.1 hypothetical protein [Endozoicomonas sp. OPT23]